MREKTRTVPSLAFLGKNRQKSLHFAQLFASCDIYTIPEEWCHGMVIRKSFDFLYLLCYIMYYEQSQVYLGIQNLVQRLG